MRSRAVTRHRRHCRTTLLATLAAAACGGGEAGARGFDDLFQEVATVRLVESNDDPIVGITSLTRRPGGGFVLTDGASSRVHVYDPSGGLERSLGGRGDGPGELEDPTAAIEMPDGRVAVTQRANDRLTVFGTDGEPLIRRVPGLYGAWLAPLDDTTVVAIVGSRDERLAVLTLDGDATARFGSIDPVVNDTPFWIFFARQHAAVVGRNVVINTSFFATLSVFSPDGDSLRTLGTPPPSWVPPTPPSIEGIDRPEDRGRLEEWAGSFTVVRRIAPVADSLIVVQYGRHRPTDDDPYHIEPTTIDVYGASGDKLVEDVPFAGPILGGSGELLVLAGEPPGPWTVSVYRWRK